MKMYGKKKENSKRENVMALDLFYSDQAEGNDDKTTTPTKDPLIQCSEKENIF